MATQQQINQHDRLMRDLVEEFGTGLEPLFTEFFDTLAGIPNPSREQIQTEFQRFRTYVREQIQTVGTVVESNTQLNATQLTVNDTANIQRLAGELEASVNATLDETQNSVVTALVMGAVAGSATNEIVKELRTASESRSRTIQNSFNNNLRNFDGAVTFVTTPPEARYEYVGGVIKESRQFCRSLDGARMTESEIRDLWASEDWPGKEAGDPFIVRGGYNCRHMWVRIEEEE